MYTGTSIGIGTCTGTDTSSTGGCSGGGSGAFLFPADSLGSNYFLFGLCSGAGRELDFCWGGLTVLTGV